VSLFGRSARREESALAVARSRSWFGDWWRLGDGLGWFWDWLIRRKRMAVAAYFPNDPTRKDRNGAAMDWDWVLRSGIG